MDNINELITGALGPERAAALDSVVGVIRSAPKDPDGTRAAASSIVGRVVGSAAEEVAGKLASRAIRVLQERLGHASR